MEAHIHREFSVAPFLRFAMTVVQDENTDHGYRIVDYDPNVADSSFTAVFHRHMSRPLHDTEGGSVRGLTGTATVIRYPADTDFFDCATRSVPSALRCSSGRP